MRYSDLHTHTVFSDGIHTMEENVRAAQAQQMLYIGFSDHSHTPCDLSYCMHKERYGAYLREAERWKRESEIPVYIGLELDANSRDDVSVYDYIIASAHYVFSKGVCYPVDHAPELLEACIREGFGGNVLEMAKCYFETLCEHVAKVRPTFVGHFDVLTKFSMIPEEETGYLELAQTYLKEVIRLCPYLELNLGAMAKGWRQTPYPAEYLLDTVRSSGGKLLLSSDSHRTEHLTYRFDEAVALLRKSGFDCIHVFNGDGFEAQPI